MCTIAFHPGALPGAALGLLRFVALAAAICPAVAQPKVEATPSYLPQAEGPVLMERFDVRDQAEVRPYTFQRSLTATKTDTPLIEVPQAVTIVTRELIDDQGMRSMGDVTRYVPGVGIAQGEGNRDTPVLRGNSTTADFFIDGVRDDVQYFRDLYNVDRVEIMKGPNAMIFGRGGSGGVINRLTKQAMGGTGSELSIQAGSWSQYRATLDAGGTIDRNVAFRTTGLYEDSGSFRDGVTLRRHGVNPTLAWRVTPVMTVRAGYENFHDERVADRGISSFQGRPVPTAPATFFGDPARSPSTATVHTGFAVLERRFANGTLLRNHTRFSRYDKFYQNVFPGAVNGSGASVSISAYSNATGRDNLFNQTDVVIPFATGALNHQVLAGLELARQETDNLRLTGYFTTVSPTTTSVLVPLANPRTTLPLAFRASASDASNHGVAKTVALYAQDQVALLPQLQAIFGLRVEEFAVEFLNHRTAARLDSRDQLVSPRAGLIYRPIAPVAIYTGYSLAHVPRAGEQLSSLSLTNHSLEPEEFTNLELGVKWDARPELAFTAAMYRLDRRNVAIPDPTDTTRSILIDGQRAKGLELGVTGRLARRWSIAGGYAYQDSRLLATQSATAVAGARLAQLPRHTLSFWQRFDLTPSWGLGAGAIFRDAIFASTDNTVTLPGFFRFDAALFCRFSPKVRAQINVENVFDRGYYASAHSNTNITPGSPRAFRLVLTTRF